MMRWDEFKDVAPKLGITTFPDEPEKYEYGFGLHPDVSGLISWQGTFWSGANGGSLMVLYARPLPAPVVHPLFGELPEGCDTVARRSDVPELANDFAIGVWDAHDNAFVDDYKPFDPGDIIAYNSKEINKP